MILPCVSAVAATRRLIVQPGLLALALLLVSVCASAQWVPNADAFYDEALKGADGPAPLGNDLFGERVELQTGATEFRPSCRWPPMWRGMPRIGRTGLSRCEDRWRPESLYCRTAEPGD